MPFRVDFLPRATCQLRGLPTATNNRILQRIMTLSDNPRRPGVQKLHGSESYRIRVGDYRVLYVIDDQAETVTIASIGHRREVYR